MQYFDLYADSEKPNRRRHQFDWDANKTSAFQSGLTKISVYKILLLKVCKPLGPFEKIRQQIHSILRSAVDSGLYGSLSHDSKNNYSRNFNKIIIFMK